MVPILYTLGIKTISLSRLSMGERLARRREDNEPLIYYNARWIIFENPHSALLRPKGTSKMILTQLRVMSVTPNIELGNRI